MSGRLTRQKSKAKRRKAQEAQALRRRARQADAERVQRAEQALKHARARRRREIQHGARADSGIDRETTRRLCHFSRLMRLAGKERRRLRRLVEASHAALPSARSYGGIALMSLAARHQWVRKPEAFEVSYGTPARKRSAFLRHLLVRWPVPSFLLHGIRQSAGMVIRIPEELAWVIRLIARLGQGGSLTEPGLLPVPLTKRMRARFLAAPQGLTPVGALRYAQVVGAGGSQRLFDAVMRTRLVQLQGSHPAHGEAYWHGILGWMASRPSLPLCELPWLVQWLRALRLQGDDYDPRGRPMPSVLRRMEAYRRRAATLQWEPNGWAPSGISGHRSPDKQWSITEIRTSSDLFDEGKAMRHCAWSYRDKTDGGEVALFSMRREGERVGTIEVSLPLGQVTQAKGKANTPLASGARGILRTWARHNHLSVVIRGW